MGTTTNFTWTYPTVGASTDTWGATLNTLFEAVDTDLQAVKVTADGAVQVANNLSDVTASTARTNLGLVIGTNVQAYDATLAGLAGLAVSADQLIYATGTDAFAVSSLTAFGRSLIDDANAGAARTTLGLGTMATAATSDYAALTGATFTGAVAGTTASFTSVTASGALEGATVEARIKTSTETTTLTSASANTVVKAAGTIDLPSSGMTDGDVILIDPRGSARQINRPGSHTMYVNDTDSATATTSAHNIVTCMFHGSSKWTVQGAVS